MIPEQTRHPVDALHQELRRALDQQLERLTAEYDAALEDARRAASREAEAAAAARLETLQAEWTARLDADVAAARREAEQQTAAAVAKTQAEAAQQTAAAVAQARTEAAQQAVEAVAKVRQEVEQHAADATARLREEFEQRLTAERASAEQVREAAQAEIEQARHAAHAEHEQSLAQVRVEAAEAAVRLRDELEQRFASQHREAEAAWHGERTEAEQRVAKLTSDVEAAQAHVDTNAAMFARDAEAARQRADEQLGRLSQDLDAARKQVDAAQRQLDDAHKQLEMAYGELDVTRAELDEARTVSASVQSNQNEAVVERESQLAGFDRLAAALRALDETGSLSQTLETLLQQAAAVAGRAIVFLITGERLKSWKTSGFPELDAQPFEASITGTGLLAQALQTGDVTASAPGRPAPTFANVPADRASLAVPLFVGDRVVALLYADNVGASAEVPSAWPEIVEAIARHAARVLGLFTAARRIEALTGSASGIVRGPASDEAGARRYARLLLSEIKLYNEAAVRQGREQRDLRSRLAAEIDRARRLYEERVPAALADRGRFFDQELLQTLADGDPALLGSPS